MEETVGSDVFKKRTVRHNTYDERSKSHGHNHVFFCPGET